MISNSTLLICLAKINQLELLKKIFEKVIITNAVKEEVMIFEKPGYAILQNSIEEGWIKIVDPKNNADYGIGKGENSVINISREVNDDIILDDAIAIKIAKSLGLNYIRTTGIFLLALKKKLIKKEECKKYINEIIKNGYYISPKIYVELIEIIDKEF